MSIGEVAAAFDAVCTHIADEVRRLPALADRVERIHRDLASTIGTSTHPKAQDAVRGYADAARRLRQAAQHLTACAAATTAYRSLITGTSSVELQGHGFAAGAVQPYGPGITSDQAAPRGPDVESFVPRPAFRYRHGFLTDGVYRVNSMANRRIVNVYRRDNGTIHASPGSPVIDLDDILQPWKDTQPWVHPLPDWNEDAAEEVARQVATRFDADIDWDPPDEEWTWIISDDSGKAMASTLFPLAIAVREGREAFAVAAPNLVVVEVPDLDAEELRASPNVLGATLLRFGWADDFDTNAFCARDLFVESV